MSKITVSRVLRAPEKVGAETRARVQAAIEKLGYVPDGTAGILSSRTRTLVGALMTNLDGAIFGTSIEGLSTRLRTNGFDLYFASTDSPGGLEADLISNLLRLRPAGIVLMNSDHSPEAVKRLREAQVTVVEVMVLPEEPIDVAVGFSNEDAVAAMTRFLYDLGRRNIAYIGGSIPWTLRGQMRLDGFLRTYRALGLGELPTIPFDPNIPSAADRGAAAMRWVLNNLPDTDAVCCGTDALAMGAIGEAWRQGKDVPGDIAIAGIGDFEASGDHGIGLTSVRIPDFKIGEVAAQVIIDRAQGASRTGKVIDLGFEIVRRASA